MSISQIKGRPRMLDLVRHVTLSDLPVLIFLSAFCTSRVNSLDGQGSTQMLC